MESAHVANEGLGDRGRCFRCEFECAARDFFRCGSAVPGLHQLRRQTEGTADDGGQQDIVPNHRLHSADHFQRHGNASSGRQVSQGHIRLSPQGFDLQMRIEITGQAVRAQVSAHLAQGLRDLRRIRQKRRQGKILDPLSAELALSRTSVDARVDQNSVVRSGRVDNMAQQDLAVRIGQENASGSKVVVDEIKVKQPT